MKKFVFCLILALFGVVTFQAMGQSAEFTRIKKELDRKVSLNLWDEVLILAPDLVIEDPLNGEGYYYTALAFLKLDDRENARKYLLKAKTMADQELLQRISALEASMDSANHLKQYIRIASDAERAGRRGEAAKAWSDAWQLDKYRIDHALNAVGHYLELKNYEAALEILQDPLVIRDVQAKQLIQKINATPTMTATNGYNQAIAEADRQFNLGEFDKARENYDRALSFRKDDSYASQQRNAAIEEATWKQAINSQYVESTENYADKYPYGKYIDQANNTLRKSYYSIAENYFNENDANGLARFYDRYRYRFGGDSKTAQMVDWLQKLYTNSGDSYFKDKDWSSAQSFYQKCIDLDEDSRLARHSADRYKKCDRKLAQEGTSFLLYSYDEQSPIGLTVGDVKLRRAAFYMTIKSNADVYKGLGVIYTIDNLGNNDSPWDTQRTGVISEGNICMSMGATFKLFYPLWMHIGAGGGYAPVFEEVDEFDSNGDYYDTVWMRNTDKTGFLYYPEAGLLLKVGKSLVIKYTAFYFNETVFNQFGLGFQF